MLLLLILPILVSGFIVCTRAPKYYYRLHRYENQYLYLKCAQLGLTTLIYATLLIHFVLPLLSFLPIDLLQQYSYLDSLHHIKQAFLDVGYGDKDGATAMALVIAMSLVSIGISFVWVKISVYFMRKSADGDDTIARLFLLRKIVVDNPLEILLLNALIFQKPVLLTLESRQVIYGFIIALPSPNENKGMDQEISVLPLLSGHLDEKTFTITFNKNSCFRHMKDGVVIQRDIIQTACEFNLAAYNKSKAPIETESV